MECRKTEEKPRIKTRKDWRYGDGVLAGHAWLAYQKMEI